MKMRWWAAALSLSAVVTMSGCEMPEDPGTGSGSASQSKRTKNRAAKDKPSGPSMTSGQENAVGSAQDYVDMTGFSKKGLIQQLSSAEGYSRADATFAADHVDADWNAEAVESAQSYLDMTSFSESGLIQQLTSAEGFTSEQARYAVGKVY